MQRACLEARTFLKWGKIHLTNKYRSVPEDWIETIRPSRSKGLQSEFRARQYFSLDEVRNLTNIRVDRLIDERDQAATAFIFLSGMRISAFVTLPISCVDLNNQSVDQFPSEGVQTKNSKAARTFLLPVRDLLLTIEGWHKKVKRDLGNQAYWYPTLSIDGMNYALSMNLGGSESRRMSFSRGLKRLCGQANIAYKSPHKLRNGHGVYGVKVARTIEEFKAFSQNMRHESMEITDRLYGRLANDDIRKTISQFREKDSEGNEDEKLFNQFREFQEWKKSQKC